MPMDKAVNIAAQILAGLEYAHRSGLIHRDIKPQNVLITPDGTVKVTDFGIAKSVSDLGLTEAGMALGTAQYFSPEQAKGERVVPQSDIYAVGVTLYEMLTGRLPFESESAVGLAYKHIGEMPVSPRHFNPNVPQRLEAIVMKALAKEPQHRYTSAAEMERSLRSIQLSGQQSTMEVPVPTARPNVTGGGSRTLGRGAAGTTGRIGPNGTPTGSMRTSGPPRGVYPAAAAAGATTRQVTSPIGAPASVALRPTTVRVQSGSGGCSVAAVTFFLVGLLAVLIGGYVILSPQMPNWFQEVVIPSPTPTATVPTATPTFTPVPPTHTPTFTPTYTATPTNTPVSVAVPNLVGLGINDAGILARQKGFVLYELERVESVEYPEGVVVQQDPPANKLYQQTRQISVRVSKGPPFFKLPNLANTDPEQARTTLESAGLKVQILSEGSANVPKGIVIRTVPVADANVRPGDTIQVFVSRGETARVPNLIGIENADLGRQRLEAAGLILGSVSEADDPTESVPPGAVLSQSPQAGVEVEKGTLVDIILRRRP
jgi:eukaryotic-like serine/threonine-protein kinase